MSMRRSSSCGQGDKSAGDTLQPLEMVEVEKIWRCQETSYGRRLERWGGGEGIDDVDVNHRIAPVQAVGLLNEGEEKLFVM